MKQPDSPDSIRKKMSSDFHLFQGLKFNTIFQRANIAFFSHNTHFTALKISFTVNTLAGVGDRSCLNRFKHALPATGHYLDMGDSPALPMVHGQRIKLAFPID
nr:hypothetical protein [Muribaculum intestinale]